MISYVKVQLFILLLKKMSLLEQIAKKRLSLKPCDTLITFPSGLVIKQSSVTSANSSSSVVGMATGFVVDDEPDLQIAHIIPGLCMGAQDVVSSPELLESCKITHILSIGVYPYVDEKKFTHLCVPLLDLPDANLETALIQCFPFIKEGIRKGIVYVHCNAGISRSSSIVMAYLISEGMTYNEAYDMVKSKRKVIQPNVGFQGYLKEYERRVLELAQKSTS